MNREICIGLLKNLIGIYDTQRISKMLDYLIENNIIDNNYNIDYNKVTDTIWESMLKII